VEQETIEQIVYRSAKVQIIPDAMPLAIDLQGL